MSLDQFLLSADTTDLNYPEVRPTLDLNFARVKALDPRITFTRASGGSYVGADGLIKYAGVNQARFDHNPYTGESLGLLVEESRSNLLVRSEDFSQSLIWRLLIEFSRGTVNTTATTAPDGTQTGNFITNIDNTSNFNFTFQNAANSTKGLYTYSIFLKDNNLGEIDLLVGTESYGANSNFVRLRYNFLTKISTITGYVGLSNWVTSFGAVEYPNGWVRLFVSFDTTSFAVQTNLSMGFYLGTAGNTSSFFNKSFFAWGAQLEAGAFPTSYIPTEGSTRTRAADNASITGKNFSDFYNPSEGTVLCNGRIIKLNQPTYGQIFWAIGDSSTFNESMYLVNDTSTNVIQYNLFDNGSNQFQTASSTITDNSFNKTAVAIKLNDSAGSFNSSTPTTDTSCTLPTVNSLKIGNASWGTLNPLNGTISRLTYYPKRLPNAQLQALTR